MGRSLKSGILKLLPTRLAGRLRAWKLRRMIRNFEPRVVEHRYGSGTFKVWIPDPLSQAWYDRDWDNLPEIEALKASRLRPGAKVFDIGAHQGLVAMMLAREVGPQGRVLAVEALSHNVKAVRENIRLNGLTMLDVLEVAVSDRPGRIAFNEGTNGAIDDGTGGYGVVEVQAVTIDELTATHGRPDVVFLDIEGAECLALAGATETLKGPTDFFVEVHAGHWLEKLNGSVEMVLSHFPADHFELTAKSTTDPEFKPFVKGDPLTLQRFFLIARSKK